MKNNNKYHCNQSFSQKFFCAYATSCHLYNEKRRRSYYVAILSQKFSQSPVLASRSAASKSVVVSVPVPQSMESASPSMPVNLSFPLLSPKRSFSPSPPSNLLFPLPPRASMPESPPNM